MYSLDAMHLMLCTALVESKLTHIKQLPDGPAIGFMQVEWLTYIDCLRYLELRDELAAKILKYCERQHFPTMPVTFMGDITLNVLIARVKYWMVRERIPSWRDPLAQANYYERFYQINPNIDKTHEFVTQAKNITGWINTSPIISI